MSAHAWRRLYHRSALLECPPDLIWPLGELDCIIRPSKLCLAPERLVPFFDGTDLLRGCLASIVQAAELGVDRHGLPWRCESAGGGHGRRFLCANRAATGRSARWCSMLIYPMRG